MAGMTFEFLEGIDPAHIGSLLDGELPQTIALVLAHLRPGQVCVPVQVYGREALPTRPTDTF